MTATDGPDKDKEPRIVRLRGVDQLSAKFTGANVRVVPGTHNKGLFLELADGEEYRITHPTAAVAGLLRASPYATITDSTTITCLRPARGEEDQGNGKRLRAIVQYIEEVRLHLPFTRICAASSSAALSSELDHAPTVLGRRRRIRVVAERSGFRSRGGRD